MSKVFIIEQTKIFTTFSIGVSRYPQDAQDCDTLLRNADTAMYKAKEMGKNQYQFYDPKMTELAVKRASIEHDLRLALKNNELEPYFQVKIDALNEKTIGIESLVRWNHPTLGLIMPDTFISIAESTGLIFALDELIMEKSIQQVQKWQEEGLDVGTLSLNVCIRHLEKEDYIDTLQSILSKYNYDPKKLEIEITETQVMKNPDKTIKTLQKIRDLNVHISIDDFGTGYSSLSYLKRFPIDKLKIDRSFTQDLPDDKNDVAIVKTIIAMAKNLDINLLAEGVETKEQRDFLLQEGCQNMQGYYYSKPLAANEYKKFIQRYQ